VARICVASQPRIGTARVCASDAGNALLPDADARCDSQPMSVYFK
jgi:hypothetical protein